MLVDAAGRVAGTIGGGIMEANAVRTSQSMLELKNPLSQLQLKIHQSRAPEHQASGMICAGRQWLAFQLLGPLQAPLVHQIASTVALGTPGQLSLSPNGLNYHHSGTTQKGNAFEQNADQWRYRESTGLPDTLYVVGGGHVGLAICTIFQHLDFRLTVIDPRTQVDTRPHFPTCCQWITDSYSSLHNHLIEGPQTYAVVVTAAYSSDVEALKCLTSMQLAYLGLMGSKAKIQRIFAELRELQVPEKTLARIKAPMGLPIHNRTPNEIAISLASELIALRNRERDPLQS